MNIQKPEWFTREEILRRSNNFFQDEGSWKELLWWICKSPIAEELMAEWIFVIDRNEARDTGFEDEKDPLELRTEAYQALEELRKSIEASSLIHSSRKNHMLTIISKVGSGYRDGADIRELFAEIGENQEYINNLLIDMNQRLSKQQVLLKYAFEVLEKVPYYEFDYKENTPNLVYRDVIKILPLDPSK